jgi:hypothetical protein
MRSDFGWRSSRKQSTEIKDCDVVADVEDQIGMMLNHEHAGARLSDCQEQSAKALDLLRREAGCWLVKQ